MSSPSQASASSSTSSASANSSVTSNSPDSASKSAVPSTTWPLSVSSSTKYSPTTLPSSSTYSMSDTPSPVSWSTSMSIPSGSGKSTLFNPFATFTSGSDPSAAATSRTPRLLTSNEVSPAFVSLAFARRVTRGRSAASIDIVIGVAPADAPMLWGVALNDFTVDRSMATDIPLPERAAPMIERAMTPSGSTTDGSVVS